MTMTVPYYSDDAVTIYHGDCREITEWLAADVLVTDPPYGMAHRSSRNGAYGDCSVEGDTDTTVRDTVVGLWGTKPALIFGRWSMPRPAATRMILTWDKGEHVGMGDLALPWKPNTEEVYVLGSGYGGRRGSSVLRHYAIAGTVGRRDQGTRLHPMEKPLGLLRDLIVKCPSGVIADPFMGSGSTLRAAKDLGRRAIGVEIDERYCEIAARRMGQEVLALG